MNKYTHYVVTDEDTNTFGILKCPAQILSMDALKRCVEDNLCAKILKTGTLEPIKDGSISIEFELDDDGNIYTETITLISCLVYTQSYTRK